MSDPLFYQETRLPGGPLVLSHAMPAAQSVALGVFIDVGSRDEAVAQAGMSHALEHMLFKGTNRMGVHALAEKLDELGGNANAFTSRERTCFHLHVLHEYWQESLAVLMDMVREPALPEDEWQREREVIYAEMAMVDDTPEEWVMDQHVEALFPGHALGRPVLGTHQALAEMTAADMRGYLKQHYSAGRLLIVAAGRIEHAELVEALCSLSWSETVGEQERQAPATLARGVQALKRDDEQAQMVLSFPGITIDSKDRPVAWLANQILGGGMSSRLFREVREKRGLAYSVGSHLSMLSDTGVWSMTCGSEPSRAAECVTVLRDVLGGFADSLGAEEVERAKRQMEVQFRMGLDSVEGQMLYLGGRQDEAILLSPMQWLEQIRSVDVETIRNWSRAQLEQGGLWSVAAPECALTQVCDTIGASC
ncbi:MAG: insulinase family protein [Zetaproteobacteria bacterium CG12_big_fil_rev_8_21_14_0_65_54_13]|nr:MAG: insulinase family protein [Zetaproteobacteria bacterium CG12_big_fil_rev_8_21_14_0_65_54_13]PIX55478.1 MAG: insulinase family protein [Zetaproteobacteria bacterium CG_4_10_14_3_um_filter_54_28]PJA29232.1 MAG: insulinase family protein [Zetaproteobacteria bacterium CG_4_9_14_3_um_filter_54_145]